MEGNARMWKQRNVCFSCRRALRYRKRCSGLPAAALAARSSAAAPSPSPLPSKSNVCASGSEGSAAASARPSASDGPGF